MIPQLAVRVGVPLCLNESLVSGSRAIMQGSPVAFSPATDRARTVESSGPKILMNVVETFLSTKTST